MIEFEHAGDVIDSMLTHMLINDERDRAVLMREKHALRSAEEDYLERERKRHRYERAKFQRERELSLGREREMESVNRRMEVLGQGKEKARAVSQQRETRARTTSSNHNQKERERAKSQPRERERDHTHHQDSFKRKEEFATLSQPRDERFIQHPRRRHCDDSRIQTIIIARDDPNLLHLTHHLSENKRHAAIVASRPGGDIHPALRDQPPTPPTSPKVEGFPPPRTSSKFPYGGRRRRGWRFRRR